METGDYKRKVNFSSFKVSKFQPHLFCSPYYAGFGCGATCLSLLTGVNPLKIPYRATWEDSYMVRFLQKYKWKTQKLTKNNIANRAGVSYPITSNHILLTSMMFRKREASWCVLFDGMLYHNFEITEIKPLDFINLPIVSLYLVKPPVLEEEKEKK